MLRSKKAGIIEEIRSIYESYPTVIVTHYHGIKVSEIESLRRKLRSSGAGFKVVKNTLSFIASKDLKIEGLEKDFFIGPTGIVFSLDPVTVIKDLYEFKKTNENFKILCGILDSKTIDFNTIDKLSKVSSMSELRARIAGLLNAPASKLARILQTPASTIARISREYSDK